METAGFWEIFRGILEIMWLILYWYYVGQVGTIEKGTGRRILGFFLAAICLALSVWIPLSLSWLLVAGILLLYDLFFDEDPFGKQWWRILLPGLLLAGCALLPWFFQLWNVGSSGGSLLDAGEPLITTEPLAAAAFLCNGPILFVFLLLFSIKRQSLRFWNGILTALSYLVITIFQWLLCGTGRIAVEGC